MFAVIACRVSRSNHTNLSWPKSKSTAMSEKFGEVMPEKRLWCFQLQCPDQISGPSPCMDPRVAAALKAKKFAIFFWGGRGHLIHTPYDSNPAFTNRCIYHVLIGT
jgi:hypothetical protein